MVVKGGGDRGPPHGTWHPAAIPCHSIGTKTTRLALAVVRIGISGVGIGLALALALALATLIPTVDFLFGQQ